MIDDGRIDDRRIDDRLQIKIVLLSMGRNNAKNIKTHNDKLHKAQDKEKAKKAIRAEQLKAIMKKFNEDKNS